MTFTTASSTNQVWLCSIIPDSSTLKPSGAFFSTSLFADFIKRMIEVNGNTIGWFSPEVEHINILGSIRQKHITHLSKGDPVGLLCDVYRRGDASKLYAVFSHWAIER